MKERYWVVFLSVAFRQPNGAISNVADEIQVIVKDGTHFDRKNCNGQM